MELADSILSTAASMQVLADELDRISIHSGSELHSPSRDSLQSSSKYDSAFDSHFSEDTASLSSQVVSVSYPIDVETSILPSVLTPPMPYRVAPDEEVDNSGRQSVASSKDRRKKKGKQGIESKSPRITSTNSSSSFSPLVTHQLRVKSGPSPSAQRLRDGSPSPSAQRLRDGSPSPSAQRLGDGSPSPSAHQEKSPSPSAQRLSGPSPSTHQLREMSHQLGNGCTSLSAHQLREKSRSPSSHQLREKSFSPSSHQVPSPSVHQLGNGNPLLSAHQLNSPSASPSLNQLKEKSTSPSSHQLREGHLPMLAHQQGQEDSGPPSATPQVVGQSSSPLPSATFHSHSHKTVSHLMSSMTLPTPCQPQSVYVEPKEESIGVVQVGIISDTTPTVPARYDSAGTPTKPAAVASYPTHLHRTHSSDSSSTEDDLISNDSTPTPTAERKQLPQSHHHTVEVDTQGLSPRVTIIYSTPATDTDYSDDSPLTSRHNYFPKTGTLFYQERLTPQPSPLHAARQHNVSHTIPSRYRDSTLNSQPNGKLVKRSTSILRRLKRKSGSFKDDGKLKRKLPVKRSMSERMAYNIRKGWVDYVEDLDFISQPTHPRAVGRMIDKKAGKYHVVQLYRPPSGRYGIYISQRGNKGVFISRFATNTAKKFYSGLISPGDQVIRVNGENIGHQHSVDNVYDMMTASDSVIFTVIPVNSRSDW